MIVRRREFDRILSLVVGLVVAAGLLTACGDDGPPTIDYVVDARITSYNANTVDGNADGVLMATGRLLPGFSLIGPAGQVIPDRDVGTVTREAGRPTTLRYEFTPEAAFSDGVALDCDDLLLAWAAMSGRLPGFAPATTAGYRDIESVDCAAGEKAATVTFAPGREYRDWLSLFGAGTLMPAHIVAGDAGVADVVDPIRAMDRAAIARIAESWNTGFDLIFGPVDHARFPSSGPYRIDRYSRSGGLVLVANESWWGDRPETSRIVVWGRGTDATRRLPDGRFDVVDVTTGMIDGDIAGTAGSSGPPSPARALGVEEIVLSGRGVFGDLRMRRAFASCLPRSDLARDFGGGAQVWNLRVQSPADNLAGQMNTEFGQDYQRPDIERARSLVRAATGQGADTGETSATSAALQPRTVRIGYLAPTLRWERMVGAIAASCRGAGFIVEDLSKPDMSPGALGKDVDALIVAGGASFASAGAADPSRDAYALRGGDPLNLSGTREPQVSRGVDQYAVTVSAPDRLRLARSIENAAWSTMPSVPLFAAPRTRQWKDRVGNVAAGLGRNGTGWNMDRWTIRE
ncbi:ABC transporter substrate-binding protein [Gordonia jinghuaiqii]|uniref:ABC transporter substrate-binding protein n=1 Tax=Gordonia jinghuaiqii TaxID=2758710 RepID=A0A7D7LZF1_9ACTN|nr:ABC transporter substrate-binding protein [Gordonia jinghuaiqii]MCR5976362.1 ABC transporter substrate-binding protein [Gordonia jinghuaiqii]QMT03578.1 ABC transporter substrate-binding protein [Gordonia jinghuaiqii]